MVRIMRETYNLSFVYHAIHELELVGLQLDFSLLKKVSIRRIRRIQVI